jgi:putative thioredoxin
VMNDMGATFDLSSLSATKAPAGAVSIPGWLVAGNEQVLRSYLELSQQVPVILLLSSPTDTTMRDALAKAIEDSAGRFAGLELNVAESQSIIQALGATSVPVLAAILAGQPALISQGEFDIGKLPAVLTQLAQLAEQNGLRGRVAVTQQPAISPELELAYQAIERGDYVAALDQYEKILANAPADADAKAGLAQVQLLMRLQQGEGDGSFAAADRLLAEGTPGAAFELLLVEFATADSDRRDEIRQRLIELFTLVGDDHPDALVARRRLTALLF